MAFSWRTLLAVSLCTLFASSCSRSGLPAPGSKEYASFVSAFYVGLAGLQTGEDTRAREKLTLATTLAPGEPAAWADLALFSARQQDFAKAAEYAEKARSLAPDHGGIEALLGAIASKAGNVDQALAHDRKAVELDPRNVKARQALADEIDRQQSAKSDAEAQAELEKILAQLPANVSVQLDIARIAARRGDAATLKRIAASLDSESAAWPAEPRERLAQFEAAVNGPNPRGAALQAVFLKNVLARVPAFRKSVDEVRTPAVFIAEPFVRFVKLPNPDAKPAAPDLSIAFGGMGGFAGPAPLWASALPLDDSGKFWQVEADDREVRIREGAKLAFAGKAAPGPNSVLAADLNYDFKSDLVLANAAGVRIYLQNSPAKFEDITARTKIPAAVLNGKYTGAWAFDFDLDGDLDIVLGTPSGEPVVLRNNGDNTFAVLKPFTGIDGLMAFASADVTEDGVPDVGLIDAAGALHLLINQRFGSYKESALPHDLSYGNVALAAGDVTGTGHMDFIVLASDGSVTRAFPQGEVRIAGRSVAAPSLILGDFDNNGAMDILVGDRRLLLNTGHDFIEVQVAPHFHVSTAADMNGDGRLDLIGTTDQGSPFILFGRGSKRYNWQTVRVRAAKAIGDQRINSFGIGGEIELRSGLLPQKQIIGSPVLHFGLGEQKEVDVARIVWPNGSVQAEFELKPDQSILAEQRLKGSCPMLFAWNGKQMEFVKDGAPWSPALGLHINAQAVAGIHQTEEWFKVPGEALAPREGAYDLRVTAELWETFYIDRYALQAVDHPEGTEVFTDERFAVEAPPLKIFTVTEPRPFASAHDDLGSDVSDVVRSQDATYLDTFGRGRYQGVTRDHWVELEVPASASLKELYLIASGWMHPTDATINIALGQNSDAPPKGLSIEVPDARGRWVEKKSGLGFLAGKGKTAVLEIGNLFLPGAPRRLRLRTNLEIFWDRLAWANGVPHASTSTQYASLQNADLLYRGFSAMHAANASSPEVPDYNRLAGTSQKWRDLEGYYTRHGDVRELLEKTDDRIVIMNAGDELRLRFAALPAPKPGWKRDYVMVGDGWIKDGDYNCTFSDTVLPLPYHSMRDYTKAATTLERDPAYLLHPEDWQTFHTRYISPDRFRRALWN
jgi:Tfp pilus assembly protein PilF